MTDLRTAAQQALEALQELNGWQSLAPPAASSAAVQAAINLSAALAEPVQEPVAWASKRTLARIKDFDSTIYANGGFDDAVPLYTTPLQRTPLTDGQIHDCFQQKHKDKVTERRMITRAIERAHGIE